MRTFALALALLFPPLVAHAVPGTVPFKARLEDNGIPFDGPHEFSFALYDAATEPFQLRLGKRECRQNERGQEHGAAESEAESRQGSHRGGVIAERSNRRMVTRRALGQFEPGPACVIEACCVGRLASIGVTGNGGRSQRFIGCGRS